MTLRRLTLQLVTVCYTHTHTQLQYLVEGLNNRNLRETIINYTWLLTVHGDSSRTFQICSSGKTRVGSHTLVFTPIVS